MSKITKTTTLLLLVGSVAVASYPQVSIGAKVSRYLVGARFDSDTVATWGWGVETEFLLALSRCFSLRTDVIEFRTNEGSRNSFRLNSLMSSDVVYRFPLRGAFAPYLYGGIGFVTPKVKTELDFRFGIGAQYAFSQRWKIFFEDELLKILGSSIQDLRFNGFEFVGGGMFAKLSAGIRFGG